MADGMLGALSVFHADGGYLVHDPVNRDSTLPAARSQQTDMDDPVMEPFWKFQSDVCQKSKQFNAIYVLNPLRYARALRV